jgi:hypothetical protein
MLQFTADKYAGDQIIGLYISIYVEPTVHA